MQLHCEVCQAPLRAEDVRFDLALAKCHVCGAVYDLVGRKARMPTTESQHGLAPHRPRVARPTGLREEENDQYTVLSWRWFGLNHVFTALFCAAFFTISCTVMVPSVVDAPLAVWPFLLLFLSLHLGVGALLTYWALAGFLNTTRVRVNRGEITINHGPLPWPGNRTVPAQGLTQLYCLKEWSRKPDIFGLSYGYRGPSFSLLALDQQGNKVKLLSRIKNKETALYLELVLERRLGIEDSPVAGELADRTGGA
ncbi:hypothetical protein [Vitiosangium sp. GDMCC 1.1324]|uniref:hypothetical protein n=1 Tax=Vitiosangium sp. (strain GDMCC 1.1324) TaxID=2138576 RepID=UPI000D368B94|nr:hypothetical protein [Vitiosangium sp. GDMCC 1.1324]PTL81726.1 hypothetical protein DAT35_22560 [Vitiosangium sp. GDMCC 1.1324]